MFIALAYSFSESSLRIIADRVVSRNIHSSTNKIKSNIMGKKSKNKTNSVNK